VSAAAFVPSSDRYGELVGAVVRCRSCRHGSLLERPSQGQIDAAYAHAEDAVSLDEESGQVATADRDLERIERYVRPGRLLDIGSWTGSFLVAAAARGWQAEGIEPSSWAGERARARGCHVHSSSLDEVQLDQGAFRAVVACDVLEHLLDPGAAVARIAEALEPDGVLFATVPDAGSRLARALGRRWWAVLPMHVQYFTRASMTRLLEAHGFVVEELDTHPKVFTARYYADRLGTVIPGGRRWVPALARRLGLSDRLVAPDLRDRLALVARLAPHRATA
jgi:SAM-dependent methyltransferase